MKKWIVALVATAACGCATASTRTASGPSSSTPGAIDLVVDAMAHDATGYWVGNASIDDEHVVRAVQDHPLVGVALDPGEHRIVAQLDFHPESSVAVSNFRVHEVHRVAVGEGCRLEVHVGAQIAGDGLPHVVFRDAIHCVDVAGITRSIPEPRRLQKSAGNPEEFAIRASGFAADADRYLGLALDAARALNDSALVGALADDLGAVRAARRSLDALGSGLSRPSLDQLTALVDVIAERQAHARSL